MQAPKRGSTACLICEERNGNRAVTCRQCSTLLPGKRLKRMKTASTTEVSVLARGTDSMKQRIFSCRVRREGPDYRTFVVEKEGKWIYCYRNCIAAQSVRSRSRHHHYKAWSRKCSLFWQIFRRTASSNSTKCERESSWATHTVTKHHTKGFWGSVCHTWHSSNSTTPTRIVACSPSKNNIKRCTASTALFLPMQLISDSELRFVLDLQTISKMFTLLCLYLGTGIKP